MLPSILFAEGRNTACQHFTCAMKEQQFDVDISSSKEQALALVESRAFDLAIVTADLGDFDCDGGFALCRDLRTRATRLPIIFIGDSDTEMDRLSAFRAGADEFISIRNSPAFLAARSRTLVSRLRAISADHLRRVAQQPLNSGPLTIVRPANRVFWRDQRVDLRAVDVRLLLGLVAADGEICSHRQLMVSASLTVQPNTITAAVNRIRRRFRLVDSQFDAIESVHGRGYRWVSNEAF